MQTTIQEDLLRAEMIALPVTLVLLVMVFGSAVAALLPLGVGIVAILGTNAVLRGLTEFTDVSVFALNLTTALGLGLAIDYALFIVRRFREELAAGADVRDGRRHHPAHRRPHGPLLRPHRRRVAGRDAGLPAVLPALLRLRRASRWCSWPRRPR